MLGTPAKGTQLATIQGIAPIVSGSIRDVLEQTVGLTQNIENLAGHLDIWCLYLRTYVIDLAQLAFVQHQIDPLTVVKDVLVIAYLESIAVDRQGDIVNRVGCEERDGLLGVVEWADIIGSASSSDRQAVGDEVGIDKVFRTGFTGRVGATWL